MRAHTNTLTHARILMAQATLAIEKSYKKIDERMETYLQPDPTKRLNIRLTGANTKKEQVVTEDMVAREPLAKVSVLWCVYWMDGSPRVLCVCVCGCVCVCMCLCLCLCACACVWTGAATLRRSRLCRIIWWPGAPRKSEVSCCVYCGWDARALCG